MSNASYRRICSSGFGISLSATVNVLEQKERKNMITALKIMGMGMAGIFAAMAVIMAMTYILKLLDEKAL